MTGAERPFEEGDTQADTPSRPQTTSSMPKLNPQSPPSGYAPLPSVLGLTTGGIGAGGTLVSGPLGGVRSRRGLPFATMDTDDEEDDEGQLDLTKGFEKIGSFHRGMAAAANIVGR